MVGQIMKQARNNEDASVSEDDDEVDVAVVGNRMNSFDALRVTGALLVIYGHSFVLRGRTAPRLGEIPLHTLGVMIFFCISGYLITQSAQRSRSWWTYLRNRLLRIIPGLAVVVLVSAFVIGPLLTSLSASSYFSSTATWTYLQNLVLVGRYDLPGVFQDDVHARSAANGSLWTIGVEFLCYIGVLIVSLMPRRWYLPATIAAGCGLLALAAAVPGSSETATLCALFAAASLVARAPSVIEVRPSVALAAGVALVSLSMLAGASPILLVLGLPLLVLTVGRSDLPLVRDAARFGDLSYGLYLWGYPVQQVILTLIGVQATALNFAIVTGVTALLAVASWWLIERPALRFKARPVRNLTRDTLPAQ
ncbi:acyltransferase [Rathayibacter caricis DSM 15933]|uniref:Acyltransferase n=1 Tax=Rathayibacter caricis DSM 15933 TaxID=1328867 RepID=A0A2T4UUK5_9MICO|nr:acyltransferase [Rathayibacter caricis]PTL73220.1 acyltransferase [Rathayibacter caricis DSM 15933]